MIRSSFTLILLLLLVIQAPAQREGWRRPDPAEREARERYLENLEKKLSSLSTEKLDRADLDEFKTIAKLVVRHLDREAIEVLEQKPLVDQIREVVAIHRREREEDARRFLSRQPPEVRAELEKLPTKERDARIFAIKAVQSLERSMSMAAEHELVSDDEVQRLRGLEPKEQLDEAYKLQRLIFMHVHGSELSAEERARLEGLDGRNFWRDPAVMRFQLRGRISREDIERLRGVAEGDRQALLEALRSGSSLDGFVQRGALDEAVAKRWAGLDDRERGRLLRVLERLHFSRRERPFVPFDLVWRLDEDHRRAFMKVPSEDQLRYLEENLNEKDRGLLHRRIEAMARLKPTLDGLEPGQKGLLFGVMPEVARERLLSYLPEKAKLVDAIVNDMEAAGFFLFSVPLKRELRAQLTAEEQASLADMTCEQKALFLAGRFPESFTKDLTSRLEDAGHAVPEAWSEWTAVRKIAHLNRLGLRLHGDRPGGWRSRRGRPEDRGRREPREGESQEPERRFGGRRDREMPPPDGREPGTREDDGER